jgi:hypothetical protein
MLEPGSTLPDVPVWMAPREEAMGLRTALAGDGRALLCFYVFDWSPG